MSLDTPFIARESVRRIIERIEDPALPAKEIVAPHRLVVRESTARPKPEKADAPGQAPTP